MYGEKIKLMLQSVQKTLHGLIFQPWAALEALGWLPRLLGGTLDALRGDLTLNCPEIR